MVSRASGLLARHARRLALNNENSWSTACCLGARANAAPAYGSNCGQPRRQRAIHCVVNRAGRTTVPPPFTCQVQPRIFTKLKASKAASYLGKTDCVRFRGRSGPNSPNVFFCQLPTQVRRDVFDPRRTEVARRANRLEAHSIGQETVDQACASRALQAILAAAARAVRGIPGIHVSRVFEAGTVMVAPNGRSFAALRPVPAGGVPTGCRIEPLRVRAS
jgi:hypothetical protein